MTLEHYVILLIQIAAVSSTCPVSHCTECHAVSAADYGPDISICDTCSSGFRLNSNSGECDACADTNCADCSNNNAMCTSCNVGYVKHATSGLCTECTLPNCASCSTPNVCNACNSPGQYVIRADLAGCDACADTNCFDCYPDVTVCRTCKSGFVKSSGICTGGVSAACTLPNCAFCYRSSVCDNCIEPGKYGMRPDRSGCDVCADTNCADCLIYSNVCRTCKSGFVMSETSGICTGAVSVECTLPNCASCSAPTVCETCISGPYGLRADGSGCDACADTNFSPASWTTPYAVSVKKNLSRTNFREYVLLVQIRTVSSASLTTPNAYTVNLDFSWTTLLESARLAQITVLYVRTVE